MNSAILTITSSSNEKEIIDVNYEKIQKMAFIYNALENDWTIKKLKNDSYECTKEDGTKMLGKFLQSHLKTKEILK